VRKKQYSPEFKAKVAFEAAKNHRTISQIASEYAVHPNQVSNWKKQLLAELPSLFSDRRKQKVDSSDKLVDELYRQIGQLNVELNWLQKKTNEFS